MTLGTTAILLATLLAGISLVAYGLWRGRARAEAAAGPHAALALGAAGAAPVSDMAADLAQRMEQVLAEQARRQSEAVADALAGLKADIQHLKSDVEWLAGERMIEQAITLAQTGLEAEEIGRELGLTRETAETIRMLRRH
jgi:DNA-binding NarL/FixJ family response regulator